MSNAGHAVQVLLGGSALHCVELGGNVQRYSAIKMNAGLGLLARACLLLRLEDAHAGLLYSQYHGILAACTAQHGI